MAKPTKAEALKITNQIRDLMFNEKFLNAVREASQDRQLLKQAQTDSRAFFRKRGVSIPRSLRVNISGRITICVTICGQIGPVVICVEICGTIEF